MPELEEQTIAHDVAPERTEAELDSLADSSEKATNRDRPMKETPEKGVPEVKETYEFTHNGKPVKATREQLLKWAQQGYDYPQKAQKLNQEREKWNSERQTWEKEWGTYKQIDDFARQNKEWWDTVQQAWQNRTSTGQPTAPSGQPDPYAPKFQQLEQKLSHFEQLAQTIEEEKRVAKERAEDEKLNQEIQSIRDQHKDLDWESLDESGKSLELRILEHAQQNGISSFRAAMRDLLHDDLVTKAQATAKIAVSQGIQKRTKLGVLGTSPTPTKGSQRDQRDIRKTSYEDIMSDIREDLRAGRLP